MVTDDADAFKTVVDELGLAHQVCKAHVRRNTEALVAELGAALQGDRDGSLAGCGSSEAEAAADLARLGELVRTRPVGAEQELHARHLHYRKARPPREGEQATVAYRLRLLLLDRAAVWPRLTRYRRWRGPGGERIDGTNNGSERAIGWGDQGTVSRDAGLQASGERGGGEPAGVLGGERGAAGAEGAGGAGAGAGGVRGAGAWATRPGGQTGLADDLATDLETTTPAPRGRTAPRASAHAPGAPAVWVLPDRRAAGRRGAGAQAAHECGSAARNECTKYPTRVRRGMAAGTAAATADALRGPHPGVGRSFTACKMPRGVGLAPGGSAAPGGRTARRRLTQGKIPESEILRLRLL